MKIHSVSKILLPLRLELLQANRDQSKRHFLNFRFLSRYPGVLVHAAFNRRLLSRYPACL